MEILLDCIGTIKKWFDIVVEVRGKTTLVEIKKNIDNVEKDLFKFILLKHSPKGHEYRKIMVIWEEEDRSGSYAKILEFAKSKNWIDEWFYFCRGRNFEKEKQKLKNFLLH
jgi:hypothetical protein